MAQQQFEVEGLKEVTFAAGDTVMAENTQGNRVYLLKSGSVTVTRGDDEICKINDAYSIFGEISSLLACPHSATVVANEDSSFYVIEDLREYCRENPDASIFIAEILARRLVNMNRYFSEFKSELNAMEALGEEMAFAKRISGLMLRMDRFWGREIVETKAPQ